MSYQAQTNWPTDLLANQPTGKLTHCLTDSLTNWLMGRQTDWLTSFLIPWLPYWKIHLSDKLLNTTDYKVILIQVIGLVGTVHRITERGDVRVQYPGFANRWTFHPASLTKVLFGFIVNYFYWRLILFIHQHIKRFCPMIKERSSDE